MKPRSTAALTTALVLAASGLAEASDYRDDTCKELVVSMARQAVQQRVAATIRRTPEVEETRSIADTFVRSVTGRSAEPKPAPPTAGASAAPPAPSADAPMDAAPRRESRRAPSRRRADSADAKAKGPASYTKTNTQELEVDEGDIVKTNGRYIFHITSMHNAAPGYMRKELRIYQSWPVRTPRLVGRYVVPPQLAHGGIEQLYIHDGHVAMIARVSAAHGARGADEGTRLGTGQIALGRNLVSRVLVLDVRNPANPTLVRHVDLDGNFLQSRMIGSRLYLATISRPLGLPVALHDDINRTTQRLAQEGVEAILSDLGDRWDAGTIDIGIPRVREVAANAPSRPIYACSDLLHDASQPNASILNLAHVDLANTTPTNGAGMNGYISASQLYASEGAFYVASPHGVQSFIRKFEIGRAGKPSFVAEGKVPGALLNQFAMSEFGGHLRVATSVNWQNNGVYVLRQRGERLEQVGAVSGLAPGERIFAVRMMGPKGYVVTFRRTDPLYTIDLSNPQFPRVVGALKIEGFSNYLHPLGDGHLLAVGQDADARGRSLGFHLQIFDVSDMTNPRRVHHEKLDAGSMSSSQSDHHAFMFEPETNTLAIPWKGRNYYGLVAYRVDAKRGFSSLGRVNHALMYKRYFRNVCRGSEQTECGNRNYWWRFFNANDLDVDRVVAIDGHLFSMSRSGLMVHAVGRKLRQRASVLVKEPAWRPSDTSGATVATGPRW